MAYNFPDAPTPGTVFNQWTWNGTAWVLTPPAPLLAGGGQTTTGGYRFVPYTVPGTEGGNTGTTYTPDAYKGNYQILTNSGAHTWAVPGFECAMDVLVLNSATAGAITFAAGYVVGSNTGDLRTTTNGHKFIFSLRRFSAAVSTYVIKALQ